MDENRPGKTNEELIAKHRETRRNVARQLRERLTAITEFPLDRFLRRDFARQGIAKATFEGFENRFLDIQEQAERILGLEIESASTGKIGELSSKTNEVISLLQQIDELSSEGQALDNLQREVNRIRKALQDLTPLFMDAAGGFLPFVSMASENAKKVADQGRQLVEEFKGELEASKKEAHAAAQEAKTAAQQAKDALENVALSKHAEYFKRASETHDKMAKRWLAATIVSLVVAAGTIGFLLYVDAGVGCERPSGNETRRKVESEGTAHVVKGFAYRLALFSTLFLAVAWTSRSYKAHRHNHTVNLHRQNALSTVEAFSTATKEDPELQGVVLEQACRAIFTPQPTGYGSRDSEQPSATQLLEIYRGAAKNG